MGEQGYLLGAYARGITGTLLTSLDGETPYARSPNTNRGIPMDEITITMDTETGDLTCLDSSMAAAFKGLGTVTTKRASHVEPANFFLRQAFTVIRMLVSDDSRLAGWTRTWSCLWRVNTKPVGGPILPLAFCDRRVAIEYEIQFLNEFFLEAK